MLSIGSRTYICKEQLYRDVDETKIKNIHESNFLVIVSNRRGCLQIMKLIDATLFVRV